MRKIHIYVVALVIILNLSFFAGGLLADIDDVRDSTEAEANEAEDELSKANTATSPSIAFDEFLHAGGSFWRPTSINHFSGTLSLGFLDWDGINGWGTFLDFTVMLEYSIEQYTNTPLSLFAQTGLAIHYVDIVESDTNIGLLNFWLGGKYRMFSGNQIPNLHLSFLAMLGIGYNDGSGNVGNGQFAGPYMLNSGDFSLIFGGVATYIINQQMGVGGSFLIQFFTWESGAIDKDELGLLLHFEFYYVVNQDITGHAGFSGNLDDDIDNQNWKLFAQAMHVSGFYGQVILPLEGNGFLIVFMGGYNMTFK